MTTASRPALFAVCAFLAAATSATAFAQPAPYFTNVTTEAGLAGKPGFRLSVADVNGDGYPDVFLHRQSSPSTGDVLNKQYLYINVPGDDPGDPFSRQFVDRTAESGIRANRLGTTEGRHSDSAIFADVDNDGDLDVFTMVYLHDSYTLNKGKNDLLLNDGQGHFTLAPNSPFHTEPIYNTAAGVFVDYDNDGKIDLFIGNWYWNGALTRDQLYRGGGDGSFTNTTTASGIGSATTCIYGVATFDWNNDGFADLFAPPYAWTVLNSVPLHWRNNGNGTFTRVESTTNYDDYRGTLSQKASFGSMPRDFDNDGDIDFYEILTHGVGDGGAGGAVHSTAVSNINGVFSWDFSRMTGRATEDPDMTHHGDHYQSWFDWNGDGLADFVLTESGYSNNRIYLYKQQSNTTFSPVTVNSGLNDINTANLPPHNAIPLDYDLDGDEDLLVGFADDVTGIRLYENTVGTMNNWIAVTARGAGVAHRANRAGIGARIQVTAGGRTQTREVYAGAGHHGPQAPLAQTFGLGAATVVDSIRVRWPNEALTVTELTNIAVNQFVTIEEPCRPADPAGLRVDKNSADILLTWTDPAVAGLTWNVYRDISPDPALWGAPYAPGVSDEDPSSPGIQFTNAGAAPPEIGSFFYLVSAVNDCGESPIP